MIQSACVLVTILLCFSIFFVIPGLHRVYGLGLFSKGEKPFGKSMMIGLLNFGISG